MSRIFKCLWCPQEFGSTKKWAEHFDDMHRQAATIRKEA